MKHNNRFKSNPKMKRSESQTTQSHDDHRGEPTLKKQKSKSIERTSTLIVNMEDEDESQQQQQHQHQHQSATTTNNKAMSTRQSSSSKSSSIKKHVVPDGENHQQSEHTINNSSSQESSTTTTTTSPKKKDKLFKLNDHPEHHKMKMGQEQTPPKLQKSASKFKTPNKLQHDEKEKEKETNETPILNKNELSTSSISASTGSAPPKLTLSKSFVIRAQYHPEISHLPHRTPGLFIHVCLYYVCLFVCLFMFVF